MNIIITGAGKGIGLELVKAFNPSDNHTIFAISRNIKALSSLSSSTSSKIIPIQFDLTLKNFSAELKKTVLPIIKKETGQIDILINNAGVLIKKSIEEMTDEELFSIYDTNVFSVSRLIRDLLPLMGKKEKTHIVNIGSMGGYQGSAKFPGLWAYSSSKAALAGLSECLAEEFRDKNIAVNCLALGSAQTEMLSKAFPGYKSPLTASKMAGYIKDFALNGHHFFNGKIIPVSLSTP